MTEENDLYALELQGFWMDVGQPKDYLLGMAKYLTALEKRADPTLTLKSKTIVGPVLIVSGCRLKVTHPVGSNR